jgi:hypothetical protein
LPPSDVLKTATTIGDPDPNAVLVSGKPVAHQQDDGSLARIVALAGVFLLAVTRVIVKRAVQMARR